MKFPPLDNDELVACGMSQDAVLSWDGAFASVDPPPRRLAAKLLAAALASPPPDVDRMGYMRHIRDLLMNITDWTQAADSPLTVEQRAAWATYRQALRDLPQNYSGDGPIAWPSAPE